MTENHLITGTVSDVNGPLEKSNFGKNDISLVPLKHKSHNRHKTVKESKKIEKRERDDSDEISIGSLQEHDVDRIVGHKVVRNKYLYLVKWLNYDKETYEPIECFYSKKPIDVRITGLDLDLT